MFFTEQLIISLTLENKTLSMKSIKNKYRYHEKFDNNRHLSNAVIQTRKSDDS